jgi:hypothetical protein
MFVCRICFSGAREMQGWARLDDRQRERFSGRA